MFKPTPVLLKGSRRLPLTAKQANTRGGYYKGNRTGSQGWHTIWGGYVIDLKKVRTYVVPEGVRDLRTQTLEPFVARYIPARRKDLKHQFDRPSDDIEFETVQSWNGSTRLNGELYIKMWKTDILNQELPKETNVSRQNTREENVAES